MAKKESKVTNADLVFDNKIILRSVYGKVGMKYFIQPCRDLKTGKYPDCVKRVNAHGDMIMSEEERNDYSEGKKVFFPIDHVFVITDGQVFNLDDITDKASWEAIENCPLIAKDLYAKDINGDYLIHGTMDKKETQHRRYGNAELYIDRPGVETRRRVTRKQLVIKACNFIINDEKGADGRLNMAKLLGKHMSNMPSADVEDYLLSVAEKNPQKIIDLYTGNDTSLRLLFVDAKDKKVIYIKNKVYLYGDNIALGITDDAVIEWMKQPKNLKILNLIKKDTYPEYFAEE